MTQKVHKVRIGLSDYVNIRLPQTARVIKFDTDTRDPDYLAIWYTFDVLDMQIEQTRTFYIVGTGHNVTDDTDYIGSVKLGSYIWHLFEHRMRIA